MNDLSPAPGTPQSPTKAIVATVLAAAAAFVTYWVGDPGSFTAKDAGEAALAALFASGLVGGSTYAAKNTARVR